MLKSNVVYYFFILTVRIIMLPMQVLCLVTERSLSISIPIPPPPNSPSSKSKSCGAFVLNITPRPPKRMKVVVNKLMTTNSMHTPSSAGKM